MKTSIQRNWPPAPRNKGFALVVTLSLMILLTVIAVGLLTLSSISLRASSQNEAMATARSNARLALMLAIGDLQKYAGPDRAITATSEILATPTAAVVKPNTTGVWESWDFTDDLKNGNSPDYITAKKDQKDSGRFRRWLISSAVMNAPESKDFVTKAWTGKTIGLVGNGSLGTNAPADAKVTAGLVPVSKNGKVQGSYGWHVADESVKARVNLYRDPSQNTTLAQKRALLAGHRPDPSVMKSADGTLLTSFPTDLTEVKFAEATASVGKVTDLDQAELLDQAKGKIKPFRNDITPYSMGVLADVRGGGLKQDLSSMFEMGSATANTLPTEFSGKNLYASTHGITGVSDPYWSALAGYYNSFRDPNLTDPDKNPTYAIKKDAASLAAVPDGYNPAPVIAKVDTIFSIVARPLVGQASWISNNDDALVHTFDYMVGIIISPVVTLHNPYNVNVSFQKMEVSFKNFPVAFNFMFQNNGSGAFASQSTVQGTFESINTFAYNFKVNDKTVRNDREFVMTIADWTDKNPLPGSNAVEGPIVMKPGQTLVCGVTLKPGSSYDLDTNNGTDVVAMDWQNTLFSNIKAEPAFTPGIGFETSSICPSHLRGPSPPNTTPLTTTPIASTNLYPGAQRGQIFLFLRDAAASPKITSSSSITDRFYVEYKIQRPEWYTDDNPDLNKTMMRCPPPKFEVTAKLQATDGDPLVDYARLWFNYGDQNDTDYLDYSASAKKSEVANSNKNLNKIFGDRVYRYPPTGSLTGHEFRVPSAEPYASQGALVRPIAIFSAYSRTSNGGVYETGMRTKSGADSPQINLLRDGRLAGKPFLFHNPSRSIFTVDLATEKPGVQAYELNFQPFLSNGDFEGYMDVDVTNRVPSLSGNKSSTGVKSGSYLELPSGPLQTIADFRRSNALTTSYLPHFVQPVSNSLLHPLMSPDKVIETNSSISAKELLDHSVLANHVLYDQFYFSTFATRSTTTPDTVFEQFMNGSAPLASQAFQPHMPPDKTVATAKAELFSSGKPNNDAYKIAAEYQMIRGAFNVNSTSVQAWKAVLAAMNKSEVAILSANAATLESKKATGAPVTAMSLVNGGSIIPGPLTNEADRSNNWNGYRDLTEPELETLAKKIVAEVRDRGPFLSMSEFVNRQVGPSGPRTLKGTLEAAIEKAEINEKQNATSSGAFLNQVPISTADVSDAKLYNYKTPEATIGNPAAGAPGWVNQGDLLRILEPGATVRGDTFVIRVYGEAQDASGNISARAYAEAVVQRFPEYVDPVDRPSLNVYAGGTASAANKTFGRRINLVSFRWLSGNEI